MPERLDRIEPRRPSRRKVAEDHTHQCRKPESDQHNLRVAHAEIIFLMRADIAPLAQQAFDIGLNLAGGAAPLDAAIEALRAADDKSRLAGVLNMAATIEWERKAFETAGAFAADALTMAESIGEANEAVIANATLAQVAAVLSDPRRGAHTAQALRPALDAPAGFSARAARAAADAIACTERIQTAHAGSAQ